VGEGVLHQLQMQRRLQYATFFLFVSQRPLQPVLGSDTVTGVRVLGTAGDVGEGEMHLTQVHCAGCSGALGKFRRDL